MAFPFGDHGEIGPVSGSNPATSDQPESETAAEIGIECGLLGGFPDWMARAAGALAITTYQAGKIALVGWDGRQVSLLMRHFSKPMGLAVDGSRLALACRHELCFFADAPLLAHDYLRPGQYDALYLPRLAYFTGDLNIHDLAFGRDGLWLVNTRFSCLCTLSDQFSFVPRWQPPFIKELVPQDRCHLNGLGMRDGQPVYVTALGETNEPEGWRGNKANGGILMDVATGQIVLRGLCMPHSPRWHDGRWWLLNSGTGELWMVDPQRGEHTVVCALPGYLRGLCFVDRYALIGLSQIRERHIFGGLPVQERFSKLRCGVAVIDLGTGRETGMLEFTAGCQELYDVQFLPGVLRPTILNLQKEATRQAIIAPGFSYWLHPKAEEAAVRV
jgi:uncharacterized protein (TIGR03032 family)